ncbi:Methyltransferase type 11 (fragment) [Candidatus Desulfarcum epimagneticum]|uniref:Methyltransferase type 11 n=1 Tax=uncultured Desulfobacteraceae bacterium TaxID=218296 RepID=A0A484HFJ1_9BACT
MEENYHISFPENETLPRDKEYFFVESGGKKEKIRFQDYNRIYAVPGLYDALFRLLEYKTPDTICGLLGKTLENLSLNPFELCVFEPGAGAGIIGEHLRNMGIIRLNGLDILESAREAAQRDKPGFYEAYYVADLTELPDEIDSELKKKTYQLRGYRVGERGEPYSGGGA